MVGIRKAAASSSVLAEAFSSLGGYQVKVNPFGTRSFKKNLPRVYSVLRGDLAGWSLSTCGEEQSGQHYHVTGKVDGRMNKLSPT